MGGAGPLSPAGEKSTRLAQAGKPAGHQQASPADLQTNVRESANGTYQVVISRLTLPIRSYFNNLLENTALSTLLLLPKISQHVFHADCCISYLPIRGPLLQTKKAASTKQSEAFTQRLRSKPEHRHALTLLPHSFLGCSSNTSATPSVRIAPCGQCSIQGSFFHFWRRKVPKGV